MSRPWVRSRKRRGGTLFPLVRWFVTLGLALASFTGAAWMAATRGQNVVASHQQIEPPSSELEAHLERLDLHRIAAALEVYRLREGRWPERLDLLVETQLVSPRELMRHGRHREFHYRPAGDSYVLLPPAY